MTPFLCGLLMLGLAGGVGRAAITKSTHSWLLVANKADQTLGLVDPITGRQVATIVEDGPTGHEVTVSLDGQRAYVPVYGTGGVGGRGTDGRAMRVIDLQRREIVGTVDFGHGVRPHCAVTGPKNGLIYVTTELDQSVSIIDPTSLKIVGSIPTGRPESHMLAITRDGRRGYTANVSTGTVSVLDLEAEKLAAVIDVAPQTQRIALSADDREVFTSDQKRARVAVIDTATNTVAHWIPLPAVGFGPAVTPDGRTLLLTLPHANEVAVIDLGTRQVVRTITTPKAPQEILVRPDGRVAYVSCDASGQVAAIDLQSWQVARLITVGPGADGLAWAGE